VGGAIRGGCRRGLLRPRAQLRALFPAGSAGEGRFREGHPPVRGGHRRGGGERPISSEPIANSEVAIDNIDGVLKLTLRPKSYEWEFVPVEGESFTDSRAAQCH
jgi:hypothetical protein